MKDDVLSWDCRGKRNSRVQFASAREAGMSKLKMDEMSLGVKIPLYCGPYALSGFDCDTCVM